MLEQYRKEIIEIDEQLVELLERRMEIARKVGEYKMDRNIPITDAAREEEVVERAVSRLRNEENLPLIRRFWRMILETSRSVQYRLMHGREDTDALRLGEMVRNARRPVENPTVAYQGVEGSYGHEATKAYFGAPADQRGFASFRQVCRAVQKREVDYGVLPIENNTTGAISQVRELIDRHGLYIVGEQNVRVDHCLLAPKGATLETIRSVFSHEQGMMQCTSFLDSHPEYEVSPGPNTAICAKQVAESGDLTQAAIASALAAELYGLEILQAGINDNPNNCTRFVVVAPELELRGNRDKVSLMFTTLHRPGSLQRVLSIFADYRLNLTKLESIPMGGADFEYLFAADFIGDISQNNTKRALSQVSLECRRMRILGNYRQKRRNIVLIGMPGSGKNAVGKALALQVGMEYVDTDELIERKAGRTIPEIFAQDGEQVFRDMESDCVREVASQGGLVISTGGGAVMRPENAHALRRTGYVFFINRPVEEILESVDMHGRPLLADNPEKIFDLFRLRLPVYRATADHEVRNDGELSETVGAMDTIMDLLRGGSQP